jgi:uncharacterized protein YdcH (DUF465 family)
MSKHNELNDPMTTHEELRDKICELCPELMKLEMGCELSFNSVGTTSLDGRYFVLEVKDGCVYCVARELDGEFSIRRFAIEDDFKILGKDPRLEDVMRAIEKTDSSFTVTWERGNRIDLTIKVIDENDNYLFYWKIGKPLSDQSSETVEKILEIMNIIC